MYRLSMNTILMLSLVFLTSCAGLKKFMNSGVTHQKMSERLETDAYDMDTKTLKEKVILSFNQDHDSPMIVLPMDAQHTFNMQAKENQRQENEEILKDQGFSYKGSLYKDELDVDWLSLWKDKEKELSKMMSLIKTGPYHVVDETKDQFIIVKGLRVYKGQSTGNGKSKLSVTELSELVRDPMQIKMDWFNTLKSRKLWFSLNDGPISLEKSLMKAKRDKLAELSMLHFLDQSKFVAWETELTEK